MCGYAKSSHKQILIPKEFSCNIDKIFGECSLCNKQGVCYDLTQEEYTDNGYENDIVLYYNHKKIIETNSGQLFRWNTYLYFTKHYVVIDRLNFEKYVHMFNIDYIFDLRERIIHKMILVLIEKNITII